MTDVLHSPDAQSGAVATLTGVLVTHSACRTTVRVVEGTWTFHARDVLAVRAPRGETARPGDTVVIDIRAGSTADFTRQLRIDIGERPMTLSAPPSDTFGDTGLHLLTERWAADLELPGPAERPAAFTRAYTRSHGADHGMHCDSLD